MAASNYTGSGGTAACPLCDDYEGQPSSVEAHISRMTDPVHQGEVGRSHRDDLERQAATERDGEDSNGAVDGSGEPDLTDDDFVSLDEEAAEQWRPADQDDGVEAVDDDQDDQDEQRDEEIGAATESARVVEEGTETTGVPVPVAPWKLLAGAVAVGLLWLALKQRSSGSGEEDQDDDQDDDHDAESGAQGGLLGEDVPLMEG